MNGIQRGLINRTLEQVTPWTTREDAQRLYSDLLIRIAGAGPIVRRVEVSAECKRQMRIREERESIKNRTDALGQKLQVRLTRHLLREGVAAILESSSSAALNLAANPSLASRDRKRRAWVIHQRENRSLCVSEAKWLCVRMRGRVTAYLVPNAVSDARAAFLLLQRGGVQLRPQLRAYNPGLFPPAA